MTNVKSFLKTVVLVGCLLPLGCSKSGNTELSSSGPLLATLSGAQKLGLTSGADNLSSLGVQAQENAFSDFSLVEIDSSGNSKSKNVLSLSAEVYFVGKTSNSIVVSGRFENIEWLDGDYSCYLISFSKTASSQQVSCLSKLPVGSFSPETGKSNAHYSKIGIKQKGDAFYFVSNDGENESYVSKWSDGDIAPTVLLAKPYEGIGFEDIFVDNVGGNLCVLAPAISGATLFNGKVYCGTEASSNWSDISASLTAPILAESFQFENFVVTNDKKLNMADLVVSSRSAAGNNGGLPSGFANRVSVSGGGLIVRAYAGSISHFAANGDTTVVADLNSSSLYWFKILGAGNYAWTYGGTDLNNEVNGTSLRRVNLSTLTFESTNYLSQTGLAKIYDLGYGVDGSLIVKGALSDGSLGFAKIDSNGNVSSISSSSLETFLELHDL